MSPTLLIRGIEKQGEGARENLPVGVGYRRPEQCRQLDAQRGSRKPGPLGLRAIDLALRDLSALLLRLSFWHVVRVVCAIHPKSAYELILEEAIQNIASKALNTLKKSSPVNETVQSPLHFVSGIQEAYQATCRSLKSTSRVIGASK